MGLFKDLKVYEQHTKIILKVYHEKM